MENINRITPTHEIIRVAVVNGFLILRDGICMVINELSDDRYCFKVVAETYNFDEFVSKVHSLDTQPDICLAICFTPGMNNYQTAKSIKIAFPACPLLVLSLNIGDFGIVEMLKLGTNGILLEKTARAELKTALLSLYETGVYQPKYMQKLMQRARIELIGGNYPLTEKELYQLTLFYSDKTYEEIAAILHVSINSVNKYRDKLFDRLKLQCRTREGLMQHAASMGLLTYGGN